MRVSPAHFLSSSSHPFLSEEVLKQTLNWEGIKVSGISVFASKSQAHFTELASERLFLYNIN